jgi:hypothetical protein
MSTVVVSDGNGGKTGSGSSTDYGGAIKVIAVIAALGLAAYFVLPKLQQFLSGLGSGSYYGGGGGGGYAASDNPTVPGAQGTTVGRQVIQAGQYTVPGVDNTVRSGSGLGNLFVNTGPGTPSNFFPSGAVITTSRVLDTREQAMVLQNLLTGKASENIRNAWWQPQTLTNPQNWGINSAGSPQSNIPSGTRHCPCTDALRQSGVCGRNDDWYYC